MPDSTRDSQRLLAEARNVLNDNRAGGRHRRALARSIGQGSAELKAKHTASKVARVAAAAVAIFVAATVVGLIVNGIGFTGIVIAGLAVLAATILFSRFPRMKVPQRDELNTGDVRHMVARTELWLEAQRPALPPPAVQIVDGIGVQLDALGLQLQSVDQGHPSAVEIRKLVGETLPEMVDSYRKIPSNLRTEKRPGGQTPDEQLTDSLGKISHEIDSITRQLAQGSLDDLAIKHRYLDYKYGDAEDVTVDQPLMRVALPHDLDRETLRERLRSRSHEIADHIPGGMAQVSTSWPSEDRMDMTVHAMGQDLHGHVDLEDKQVVFTVALPPALGFIEPIVGGAIKASGQKLIEAPKS